MIDEAAGSFALGLATRRAMYDEWHSVAESARTSGSHVIATLDDPSCSPKYGSRDLSMGGHSIAWVAVRG
jgi:hypothetical protein